MCKRSGFFFPNENKKKNKKLTKKALKYFCFQILKSVPKGPSQIIRILNDFKCNYFLIVCLCYKWDSQYADIHSSEILANAAN